MKTTKFKKGLSLFLAVVMLLTMMPFTDFIPAAEAAYPTMMKFTAASSGDFHKYWNKVYTVTFLDSIDTDAMSGALESWDISADQNGSVMGWMYLNEEATVAAGANRYDVYIAGDGGVGANPNSGFIFYLFSELVEVSGFEHFKTDAATTFISMFENCYKLTKVDFKNNNTENLTSMENMFKNCYELTELDLSSFNTSKVTTMRFAFYLCKKLNYIYAGDGWSTKSIANLYDGVFNCCYAKFGVTEEQYAEDIENGKQYDASGYRASFDEGGYLTYKAPESPENYTVTYKFVGDIIPDGVSVIDPATYEEGTTVTVADDASAEHYIFSGWSTEDATVDADGNFIINNDVEFVGKWEKKTVSVDGITVEKDEFTLTEGDKDTIKVTVTPDNATNKDVTYTSSDETVVKVDEKGNIEAVGEGEATITVTTEDGKKQVTVTVKVEKKDEPEQPDIPDVPDEPEEPEYVFEVPETITVTKGITELIYVKVTPDDGRYRPTFSSADERIAKVDEFGNVTGVSAGTTTIYVDFGNGIIRPVTVLVIAPAAPVIPRKHHVCFGKTDGIGWYEVSVNGGDFFPQGPNSTLEVEEGSILVIRVQDMWIDDEFDFYVNGKKVPLDPANTITVVVDGYMLIGALSMDVPVPDIEESLSLFERIVQAFERFIEWIKNLFTMKK